MATLAPTTLDTGSTAFMILSMALVLVMTPALGLFYGGLSRARDVMSIMLACMLSAAIVSVQWYLFGYSLAFSQTAQNGWIGNLANGALTNVGIAPYPAAPAIPEGVFFVYQMQFAVITPALIVGAGAGRLRLLPLMLFFLLWTTIVYDPVIYAEWAVGGWLKLLGGSGLYDFAGGVGIHVTAGAAALAYGLVLGQPRPPATKLRSVDLHSHSPLLVYIGTGLLWYGWIGFNAGSEGAANARAGIAAINSNIAASVAGMTWMGLEYIRTKHWGSIAFCTGAIAGLATITPGSGYVPVWAAVIYGLLAALICQRLITHRLRLRLNIDALDVFAVHGVGGALGTFLTGIFASSQVIALDGTVSPGGWISGNFIQLPIQMAGIAYGFGWSFFWSYALFWIINRIPSLRLRVDDVTEDRVGLDHNDVGELAYHFHWRTDQHETGARAGPANAEERSNDVALKPLTAPTDSAAPTSPAPVADASAVNTAFLMTGTPDAAPASTGAAPPRPRLTSQPSSAFLMTAPV